MITSCEKAGEICTKSQYGAINWPEKIRFKLHLLVCKACASYAVKNKKLTQLCHRARCYQYDSKEKKELENLIQHLKK